MSCFNENFDDFVSNCLLEENRKVKAFEGGRLALFADHWCKITSDSEILNVVTGLQLNFECKPFQMRLPKQHCFSAAEASAIDAEVQKLLNKGIIVETRHEEDQFVSPIFLRPKKDGTNRMILNLKELNEFVKYNHFKMDSLRSAICMMTKNCYMASLDIKDAYFSIPVAPDHRRYLKFQWRTELYMFICCPMGYSEAPRLFTKLLKPVYSVLRKKGHQSVGYIDDSYLQGQDLISCQNNVVDTVILLQKLGFILHPDKSIFIPSQQMVFLGFVLDSVNMRISLASDKAEKIKSLCSQFLKAKSPSIRDLCKLIGTLVASFPAVPYGKLFYRQLEIDKILALRKGKGNFDSPISISQLASEDLLWWERHIVNTSSPISHGEPSLMLETDASTKGWGCFCKALDIKTGGEWSSSEAMSHINVLELKAAFFALRSICSDRRNTHIHLLMDSMTAVAYVREQGGTKSLACNAVARQIWAWAYKKGIWLTASYISTAENVHADHESRHFENDKEWMLDKCVFQAVVSRLKFQPDIDLFASRHNYQINRFVSYRPCPDAYACDAMSICWSPFKVYIFCPFSLIPEVLQKMSQDKATGILIMPNRPTQAFFATAMNMLISLPVILRKSKKLLILPCRPQEIHKIWNRLDLLACLLSGDQYLTTSFQNQLQISSWLPGEKQQINNTGVTCSNGNYSVINGKLIPYLHL